MKILSCYRDFLYVEPVAINVPLGAPQLNTFAKVLAIGPDVKNTQVGEYVAFELWDKPEVPDQDNKAFHFVKESDVIAKVEPEDVV